MDPNIVNLIVAILGSSVLGSGLTLFFTRRKVAAETNQTNVKAASDQVDTTRKVSDLLEKMQSENVDLYERNTELEKVKTDYARTIEILTARLEARDSQLATVNKQLERLNNLAQQAPITETLSAQLDAVNKIATGMQAVQQELSKLLVEKEKTLQELSQTNRDLEMKKPPRS